MNTVGIYTSLSVLSLFSVLHGKALYYFCWQIRQANCSSIIHSQRAPENLLVFSS